MSTQTHAKLIVALLGITVLAAPAWAQADSKMAAHAARSEESVDQRIATLHSELKITPAEEADWQAVAQTMRDNAAALQKLATEKSQSQQPMTAIEDLQTYQQFAQQHVDGLKNLVASFQTLYNAMPDPQKKIADQVFENSMRRQSTASR